MSKLKDPQLLVLFMNGKRPKEAARIAGVHPSTVYRRLAEPDFKAQLKILTDTIVGSTAKTLTSAGRRAARRLIELLDEPNKPSIQLAAAKAIMHFGEKLRGEQDAKEPASLKQARLLHQTFGTSPPPIPTPYPPDDDQDDREPAKEAGEERAKLRQDVVESMREDVIRANVRLRGDLKMLLQQIEKEEREALEKARPRSIFKGAAEAASGPEACATPEPPGQPRGATAAGHRPGGEATFPTATTKTQRPSGPSSLGALGVVLACLASALLGATLQRGAAATFGGEHAQTAVDTTRGAVDAMDAISHSKEIPGMQRSDVGCGRSMPALAPASIHVSSSVRGHGSCCPRPRVPDRPDDAPKNAAGWHFSGVKPSQIYAKLVMVTGDSASV